MKPRLDLTRFQFCSDERTHKTLFGCLESLLEATPSLVNRICDILQGFFEFELVSEEFLTSWIASKKHKYDEAFHAKVQKASTPFFEWLQEEEEDEEEEEEEEEEKEVIDVPKAAAPSVVATTAAARKFLAAADDDSGSDIDLDDL